MYIYMNIGKLIGNKYSKLDLKVFVVMNYV